MARILIIEDEKPVRKLLRELLEDFGHEVITAIDGEVGVRLYRQEPADLVISDIFMPHKDGLEVIRELRRDFPEIKIIVITGYNPARLSVAEDLGASRTFTKPLHMQKLMVAVEELLEEATIEPISPQEA